MELEERIAIAAGAVAKIGALGERSGSPDKLAAFAQQFLQLRRRERRIGECRDHTGSAVTMLAKPRASVGIGHNSTPCCTVLGTPGICRQGPGNSRGDARALSVRQPLPA